MPDSPSTDLLLLKRDQLRAQLAEVGDMRPGSLVERYRKCGKPACHCARKGAAGHGPSYSLTHAVQGKTVTRIVPAGPAVERTRHHIAEYQRFRALVRELITVNQQLCDLQLRPAKAQFAEEVKKNSSRRVPGRRHRP
ncbi:MAG TPA: DUF6788 family protein [Candidatus Methylomirabilis sp.]|nr:DUF6788 family protein [Candidatus Methylomirabilis sp.]